MKKLKETEAIDDGTACLENRRQLGHRRRHSVGISQPWRHHHPAARDEAAQEK
jgi:hypothetical protein